MLFAAMWDVDLSMLLTVMFNKVKTYMRHNTATATEKNVILQGTC